MMSCAIMSKKNKSLISFGDVANNRKARYEYSIGDTFAAGLVLTGNEVKALRLGRANITEAYVAIEGNYLVLINADIAKYQNHKINSNIDSRRKRIILLKKKEISKLIGILNKKRTTIVPLRLFFNDKGIAKIILCLATGKNKVDKRQVIKDREWQRNKLSVLKQQSR